MSDRLQAGPTMELAARMRADLHRLSPARLLSAAREELEDEIAAVELYRHAMIHAGAFEAVFDGGIEVCPRCGEHFGRNG